MHKANAPLEHLEYTICNVCGSEAYTMYHEQEDMRYDDTPRGKFQLVKCSNCALIYLNPRPPENKIGLFYPASFYSDRPASTGIERSALRRLLDFLDMGKRRSRKALAEKLSILSSNRSRVGKVLDVGCAAGEFLKSARSLGWEVEGVDISEEMCSYVNGTHNIVCHNSSINHLELPESSFDAVTFWASMEHLYDPKAALSACHRMLRPGGIVIVLVPNSESLEEKWLGKADPNPIDIPRHLYHFSAASMKSLIEATGFTEKRVRHFTRNAADRFAVVIGDGVFKHIPPSSPVTKLARFVGGNFAVVFGDVISRLLATVGRSHTFIYIAERK